MAAKEWKPAFGLYWHPKEWRILQRLELMHLAITSIQAQSVVRAYRDQVERAAVLGAMIGWIAGLAFSFAIR